MPFKINFYKTPAGNQPVKKYLQKLKESPDPSENEMFDEINTFLIALRKKGNSLGMPMVKHLQGTDLWELRPLPHRIIYCVMDGNQIVLLYIFVKKSQATPKTELDTALERYKILRRR